MRVLFLTHRLPYAPNRGDRTRAFHIVRTLAPQVELELVSLAHDPNELAQAEQVRGLGVRVTVLPVSSSFRNSAAAMVALAGTRPLTHVFLNAPLFAQSLQTIVLERPPDVVLAYCSSMARFALEPPLSKCPFVLDLIDVDSQKWAAMAATTRWPKRWVYQREARDLERFEREAVMRAHVTLVVNEREQRSLQHIAPQAAIRILPIGVDADALRPRSSPTEQPDVIFCGVMNYGPNVEAVVWFSREVWPIIRARRPDARFFIVGSDPTAAVRRLASARVGIEVTGTVAEIQSHLWSAAISVAPLKIARGVQNKVLEALAAGLPVVATPQVIEGLPTEALAACRVADAPGEFAEQTLSLLALSGQERRALAAQADLCGLNWEHQLAPLREILAKAASQGHRPGR